MNFLILWCHITLDTIDRLFRRSAIPFFLLSFSLLWLNFITLSPQYHPNHGDVVLAGDGVMDSVLPFLFPDEWSPWAYFSAFQLVPSANSDTWYGQPLNAEPCSACSMYSSRWVRCTEMILRILNHFPGPKALDAAFGQSFPFYFTFSSTGWFELYTAQIHILFLL